MKPTRQRLLLTRLQRVNKTNLSLTLMLKKMKMATHRLPLMEFKQK